VGGGGGGGNLRGSARKRGGVGCAWVEGRRGGVGVVVEGEGGRGREEASAVENGRQIWENVCSSRRVGVGA
jgi:hypothetical protein